MDNLLTTLAPIALKAAGSYISNHSSSPAETLSTEAAADNASAIEDILSKNPSIDRTPALVAAATAGKLNALDALLTPPAQPHHHHHSKDTHDFQKHALNSWSDGTTPLLAAVKNKHSKSTKLLLESGADPNLINSKTHSSPLQLAAKEGDAEIAQLLLSFGADVNYRDSAKDTALIIASRWGQPHAASCLIENGADMEARNVKGGTALLVAARHDCVEVLKVLLRKGADVNVSDKNGKGVLHRVVEGPWVIEQVPASVKAEMIKMLLKAGADPGLRDKQGKTAAERTGWAEKGLASLLEGRRNEHTQHEHSQHEHSQHEHSQHDGRHEHSQHEHRYGDQGQAEKSTKV